MLLETYIKDSREKHRLFNAIETIPCVARKAKWALDWIHRYFSLLLLSNKSYPMFWKGEKGEEKKVSKENNGTFLFFLEDEEKMGGRRFLSGKFMRGHKRFSLHIE